MIDASARGKIAVSYGCLHGIRAERRTEQRSPPLRQVDAEPAPA
jgi:hypothetical protein